MEKKKGFLSRIASHARGIQLTLLILAGLFALYSLFGFFALPPILESILVKNIEAKTGRQTAIQDVSVNPYWLTAGVNGLMVKDRDGTPFLSFNRLFIDYEIMSVFKKGTILREVRLSGPYVKVVRERDLTYNLSELFKGKKPAEKKKPSLYSVNNIQISGGRLDFHDIPKKSVHNLSDMNLAVPFISNLDYYVDTFVQPRFYAHLDGRLISLKGRTKPFAASRETEFDINLQDLDLTRYVEYMPEGYRFNIKSGVVDAKGKLSFIQASKGGGKTVPSLRLAGLFTLTDFSLGGREGSSLIKVPALSIALRDAEMFSMQVTIDAVEVKSPEVNLTRDKAGTFNLARLFPAKKEEPRHPAGKETGKLAIKVASVILKGGKLHFRDESNSKPFKNTLAAVNFEARDIVYDESREVGPASEFKLSAASEADESIAARGTVSLRPLKATGSLSVQDVPVKRYQPYLADSVNFEAIKGTLGVSSGFGYSDKGFVLSGLTIDLRSLALRKAGSTQDFITVPSLLVSRTDFDLKNRRLTVGSVETKGGRVAVARDKAGKMNLAGLTKPSEKQVSQTKGAKEAQWKFEVKNFALSSYGVDYNDLSVPSPVKIKAENVRLSVKNFSPAPDSRSPVSLSFTQDGEGEFRADGTLGVVPFVADLNLNIKDVDAIPFQPYFTKNINIDLASGLVSAAGGLNLTYSKAKGFGFRYSGEASVNEFESVDKAAGEEFLDWKTLYFGGVEASYSRFSLNIKQVALSDFYSRLIIYKDGTLNVQGIIKKSARQQKAQQARAPQPPPGGGMQAADGSAAVRIERVTLQGGHINFTDNLIKPSYTADLTEIGGRISGLSSSEQASADVDLRGRINGYAPVEITGKTNPLRKDLYVDLSLDMNDMDLSQLTPYSSKYVGYSIAKGKLSMNLKYLIVRRVLDSHNQFLFDELTLGARSNSPEAVQLPVKLAISLLKNRQGEISLDFPVTGKLDDPKFDFGDVILRVVLNTVKRIVTSPFALLGKLFGGGQELGYVEFDYGTAKLNTEGEKKVEALNKALFNRPELELEVAGYADPEKDKTALRSYKFIRKLKEAKYEDMSKDERPADIDQVRIKEEEYEKYLKKAYKAEKFPKPKNVLGFEKSLPVPEMEKLIMTHIEVTEEDLAKLARKRAANVEEALLRPGNVNPNRVFMVSPGTIEPEEKKDLKESRVEFGLQ